ncbi:hypothetical protein RC1_1246 [Rhodospirillum centenum SW]|uniref:Uncharacterized protein n=1 Tax=Rhodospirillum centenum (strain ATCC 51521 / SW) TaxID=414684 RepID=B6ISY5_RHOCS|nr:hypothetical protein RC1_1246 [Rhodospirillum centenum SW]
MRKDDDVSQRKHRVESTTGDIQHNAEPSHQSLPSAPVGPGPPGRPIQARPLRRRLCW